MEAYYEKLAPKVLSRTGVVVIVKVKVCVHVCVEGWLVCLLAQGVVKGMQAESDIQNG